MMMGDGKLASRTVIGKVAKYLNVLRRHGLPVSKGIIYGSNARDEAGPDSDIDLLVISPLFDENPRARVGEMWRLASEVDSHIEPVPVGEKRFEKDDVSPLLEIARQEGLVVT